MRNSSDRNLLIGILALQLDFISREQLIQAFQAWAVSKHQGVDAILVRDGAIDEETRQLILAVVDKHIANHNQDIEQSLAAVSAGDFELYQDLSSLSDPEIDANLETAIPKDAPRTSSKDHDAIDTTLPFRPNQQESRYRLLRLHAEGGLGSVFIAMDQELNREVALKEIRAPMAVDNESRNRFLLEAEVTGGLEHPGIIPVYGLGVYTDGRPYYAMRFVRGESLKDAALEFHSAAAKDRSATLQSMEFRRLIGRLVDVCNAIEYAHSRGVLHRDIKPSNVMLGKYGETLVVDWGLAKAAGKSDPAAMMDEPTLRPSSGSSAAQTVMGQVFGTPAYMSPEQAIGRIDQLSPASDVYSLGATLFFILTGRAPIREETPAKVLEKARQGKIEWPTQDEISLPPALESICRKAMAQVAADRFERADGLAQELELWLADEPVSTYREPWIARVGRSLRRHRTAAVSALATTVTACILLGITVFLVSSKNSELEAAWGTAESNRKDAVLQKDRAEDNLVTARAIALNILEIAEFHLSDVSGKELFREEMMDRCLTLYEQIENTSDGDADFLSEYARVARLSGNVKRLIKDFDEGRQRLQLAIDLQKRLQDIGSNPIAVQQTLAGTYRDLSTLESASGNLAVARSVLDEAQDMIDELEQDFSGDPALVSTQASIDFSRVGLLIDEGLKPEALRYAQSCTERYRQLESQFGLKPLDRVVMLLAISREGQLLDDLDRGSEATEVFTEGVRRGQEWTPPTAHRDLRYAYSRVLIRSAESLADKSAKAEDAESQIRNAVQLLRRLSSDHQGTLGYKLFLGEALRVRANILASQDKIVEAHSAFDEADLILGQVVDLSGLADYMHYHALALSDFAKFTTQHGSGPAAQALLQRAISLQDKAIALQPDNVDFQRQQRDFEKLQRELDGA